MPYTFRAQVGYCCQLPPLLSIQVRQRPAPAARSRRS